MTELVWYAAYGSNLWPARFLTYLTGGPVAHSPAGRIQAGARDPSPPRDQRRLLLPHPLFFARSSSGWGGGGVAFLDTRSGRPALIDSDDETAAQPEAANGRATANGAASTNGRARRTGGADGPDDRGGATLGRAWLVTRDQFVDVAHQENGVPVGADLDLSALGDGGGARHLDLFDAWYGRVVHLGTGPGGHPILTVTCPDPDTLARQAAHPSYLRVIGLGLIETWSLGPHSAARYLAGRDGNTALDPHQVATDLRRWSSPAPRTPPPPSAP